MDDETMQNNMMEEGEEEEEAFIDLQDAVEVKVEDGDEPMEEEEDMGAISNSNSNSNDNNNNEAEDVVDMSVRQYKNHAGPLYAVAACQDAATNNLWIATGGGDDRAWLHNVGSTCEHSVELGSKRTDSVSSIAWSFPLVAVGAYDGTIEVYQVDATTGQQLPQPITKLEGPTDVEWLSFHPKGGTVRPYHIIL
jgi:hypothetical protein